MSSHTIFAVLAILFLVTSSLFYIASIFKGETKLERGTYFLWGFTSIITFAAQLSEGGRQAAVLTGFFTVEGLLFFVLSFKYGYGKLSKRDKRGIAIASLGIVFWLSTDQPLIAVLASIFVDGVGAVLLLIKSIEAPYTESLPAWVAYVVGSFFGLLAVEKFTLVQMAFPVYALIWGIVIVGGLVYSRSKLSNNPIKS